MKKSALVEIEPYLGKQDPPLYGTTQYGLYGPRPNPESPIIHIIDATQEECRSACGIWRAPRCHNAQTDFDDHTFTHPGNLPSLKGTGKRFCKACVLVWFNEMEPYLRRCQVCGETLKLAKNHSNVMQQRDNGASGHINTAHALRLLSGRCEELLFGVTFGDGGPYTSAALKLRLEEAKQELKKYFSGREFVVLPFAGGMTDELIVPRTRHFYMSEHPRRMMVRGGYGFYHYLIVPR